MLFIIAMLLAVAFSWFLTKPLKKSPYAFYIGGAVVTIVVSYIGVANPEFYASLRGTFLDQYIIGIFKKGIFAAALWCVVAWTGALPNGSAPMKKLMPIRGELSIFAASVTLAHAVVYGVQYVKNLFTPAFRESRMTASFVITCIVCLLLMLIMIPLTVMSFKTIRKKMKAKVWKNMQRFAYGFYALIYIHILVIYMSRTSTSTTLLNLIVYSIVFVGYFVFRIRKWMVKTHKLENHAAALNAICAAIFLVVGGGMTACAQSLPAKKATTESSTAVTAESTTSPQTTTAETETEAASSDSDKKTTETTAKTTTETIDENKTKTTDASASETTSDETNASTESQQEEQAQQEEQEEEVQQEEQQAEQEEQQEEQVQQEEQQAQTEAPATEPEQTAYVPVIYNNGTYTGEADGFDAEAKVYVTVVVEDDKIISITATCYGESDEWYFEQARDTVINRILESQNTSVDIVAGSTFSSNAIMDATWKALNSARI